MGGIGSFEVGNSLPKSRYFEVEKIHLEAGPHLLVAVHIKDMKERRASSSLLTFTLPGQFVPLLVSEPTSSGLWQIPEMRRDIYPHGTELLLDSWIFFFLIRSQTLVK